MTRHHPAHSPSRLLLLAAFFALSIALPAHAKKKYDKAAEDTVRCNGNTSEIVSCLNGKIKEADTKLNEAYKLVLDEVKDKNQQELLRKSQRAWLDHITKELAFVNAYFGGGTYQSIRYGYTKLDMLKQRAHALEDLIRP